MIYNLLLASNFEEQAMPIFFILERRNVGRRESGGGGVRLARNSRLGTPHTGRKWQLEWADTITFP
jgi:hypothetical protein